MTSCGRWIAMALKNWCMTAMLLIQYGRIGARGAVIGGLVWLASSMMQANAAEVLLRPGDEIRVKIAGMPQLEFQAIVDNEGVLDLAWLGDFDAGAKTINEMEREVRQASIGRLIKQYNRDGILYIIQLDGDEVHLSWGAFQPVIVSGDVANPGSVEFRLNMTVRDAVALAGGTQSGVMSGLANVDPMQLLRWQSDYGLAALDHAEASVRLWRINSEIQNDYDPEPPSFETTNVAREVFSQLVAQQNELVRVKREAEAGELRFIEESIELAKERIAILKQQRQTQTEAVAADKVEEERLADLVERGLSQRSRLWDMRRDMFLSTTRLLDLEEQLAAFELEFARLQRLRDEFEELRLIALHEEREMTVEELRRSSLRMEVLTQYLGGQSSDFYTETFFAIFDYTTIVYRDTADNSEIMEVGKDFVLSPGDTLEIALSDVATPSN